MSAASRSTSYCGNTAPILISVHQLDPGQVTRVPPVPQEPVELVEATAVAFAGRGADSAGPAALVVVVARRALFEEGLRRGELLDQSDPRVLRLAGRLDGHGAAGARLGDDVGDVLALLHVVRRDAGVAAALGVPREEEPRKPVARQAVQGPEPVPPVVVEGERAAAVDGVDTRGQLLILGGDLEAAGEDHAVDL